MQELAREMETPLKTVLLAAHLRALEVLTGEKDITTGVALNGRPEIDGGERMVGLFLNTVPFRLRLESRSWRTRIRETFAAEKKIMPHRRYPMVDLRAQMGGQELYKTTFNYVHFHVYKELDQKKQRQKLLGRRDEYSLTSLDFLANFEMTADKGQLQGIVLCDTGVMSAAALERIAGYYERILATMAKDSVSDVLS